MFKRKKKKFYVGLLFNPKVMFLFSLIVLILISFPLSKNWSKRHAVNKEIKELKEEASRLENKNSNLKKLAEYFESDQFVEKEGRLKLGLKKEGESVIIIKNKERKENSGDNFENNKQIFNILADNGDELSKEINNPKRWREYFFE